MLNIFYRSLNLKGNKIVSLEPGCLNNLSSLEELLLSKNKLSSLPKGIFDKMKYLQVLDLSKNKFVEIQVMLVKNGKMLCFTIKRLLSWFFFFHHK